MDEYDRKILIELQRNARQTNKDLAEAIGLAASTTLARVRSLEARGVITGYSADIDHARIGRRVRATVSVRLQPKNREVVERFLQHAWALDETIAISLVTGPFDVIVDLSVPDVALLGDRVLNEIASFDAVVDEQTTLVIEHREKTVINPVDSAD